MKSFYCIQADVVAGSFWFWGPGQVRPKIQLSSAPKSLWIILSLLLPRLLNNQGVFGKRGRFLTCLPSPAHSLPIPQSPVGLRCNVFLRDTWPLPIWPLQPEDPPHSQNLLSTMNQDNGARLSRISLQNPMRNCVNPSPQSASKFLFSSPSNDPKTKISKTIKNPSSSSLEPSESTPNLLLRKDVFPPAFPNSVQ